jgi:cell division protein FtsN
MGREYSNKQGRSSAPSQFLIITITFLLGYFTATVFDIETLSRWVNAQVLAYHEANKAPTKPKAQQATSSPKPKPKFEFYTLLTNEKAPNSEKNIQQGSGNSLTSQTAPAQTPVTPNVASSAALQTAIKTIDATSKANVSQQTETKQAAPAIGKGVYSVQVASFKARHDAEHMKGLLILKGFNVTVVPINHAIRGVWFRVVVGPYANRALAQKAQMDLAKNEHLHGMITLG